MAESARVILGLRSKGWTDTEIADFILWVETGEAQYKPKPKTAGQGDGSGQDGN